MRPLAILLLAVSTARGEPGWIERTFQPSDKQLVNPERGLYVELADRDQRPLSRQQLQRLRNDGITLIQRLYYLKGYRDQALDDDQLELIRTDFGAIRRNGMKAIIRFAYSSRVGEPDAPLPIVLHHIGQLRPVLRANSDVILTVQAGFIGAWGEWHSSTNGLDEPVAMRSIATALLDAIPIDRTIQVRTPRYKMAILGSKQPPSPNVLERRSVAARIGHHNDCFLADATDTGTYRDVALESDRRYVADDSKFVPVGGETCREGPRTNSEFARDEMARMHWSFLNLAYHRGVIAKWRDNGLLAEVRRRLGYRLRLSRLRLMRVVSPGEQLTGSLMIINDGFATPIHNRPVLLLLVDAHGEVWIQSEIEIDLRDSSPGVEHEWPIRTRIPLDATPGEYSVRLYLPDPSPRLRSDARYAIRFANSHLATMPDGSTRLGMDVTVASTAKGATGG